MGLFFFLRSENLGELPALLGAFTFELMPKLFAHYASGHITLLFAVLWTPWLIWIEKKKTGSTGNIYHYFTGIILGMIALADVRWVVYASCLWIAFSLYCARKNLTYFSLLRWMGVKLGEGLIAFLLAAPLLLPLLQYTSLTTRSSLQPSDNLMLSLAPAQLLGLFIPQLWGYAETIVYPGILPVLLLFVVMCFPEARRKTVFWIGVILATILFSLGANLPGSRWLVSLPGISLLRIPTRWLFITFMSFSILAAYGVDALLNNGYRKLARPNPAIFYVGLTAFILFLALGVYVVSHSLPLPFLWSTFFIPIISILIIFKVNSKISTKWWFPLVFGLAILDMGGISFSQVSFQDAATVLGANKEIGNFLNQQTKPFRVYSPSYSVPQQLGSSLNLELADGIDPLQLSDYVDFMRSASGVPSAGYSVTLPAFSSGNPRIDNQAYLPDEKMLGLLNVRYVTSEYKLSSENLRPVATFDQTHIYENLQVKPCAWVQQPDLPAGEGIISEPVPLISPNQITLTATGPGLLVLSEINYPGWIVHVDNVKANIITAATILRAVNVPAGIHKISFSYEPIPLYVGLALSAFTWLGMLLLALRGKIR